MVVLCNKPVKFFVRHVIVRRIYRVINNKMDNGGRTFRYPVFCRLPVLFQKKVYFFTSHNFRKTFNPFIRGMVFVALYKRINFIVPNSMWCQICRCVLWETNNIPIIQLSQDDFYVSVLIYHNFFNNLP